MSKEHYIQFAVIIRLHSVRAEAKAMAEMVISVAKRDNPNFNKGKFLVACGLE